MTTSKNKDKQFNAFKAELEALCIKHKVRLSVSHYDSMEVWPLKIGDDPVHSNGFENMLDWKPPPTQKFHHRG